MNFKLRFFVFLIVFFVLGCDEELPPRNDPSKIFIAYMEMDYIYSPQQNGINFIVSVINNFDETLSGKTLIDGTMEIEWIVPPERIGTFIPKRTVKLNANNIFRARGYNSITGKFLIDPHDTVKFSYVWDFKFDDSTDIRNVPFFIIGAKNIGCGNTTIKNGSVVKISRFVYQSQPFKVKCNIRLFDKTAFIQIPEKIINSCSINFWPDIVCDHMLIPNPNLTPCDLH
jgi:hypothetical protein